MTHRSISLLLLLTACGGLPEEEGAAVEEAILSGPTISFCPTFPTLAHCRDPALVARCGLPPCKSLLEADAQAQIDAASRAGRLLHVDRYVQRAQIAPTRLDTILEPRQVPQDTVSAPGTWNAAELAMTASPRVASCDEYAFQKLYGYAAFRAWTRPFGKSYRRIYDLAYDPAYAWGPAIGQRGLTEPRSAIRTMRSATDLTNYPLTLGYTRAKNTFFEVPARLLYDPLAARVAASLGQPITTLDARVTALIQAGQTFRPSQTPYQLHRTLGQGLAARSEEELMFYWEKRDAFRTLVSEYLGLVEVHADPADVQAYAAAAARLDTAAILAKRDQIQAALAEAEQLGCLSTATAIHPCDWSPKDFVDALNASAGALMQKATDRCLDTIPAVAPGASELAAIAFNYAMLGVQQNGTRGPVLANTSATADERAMDLYLDRTDELESYLTSAIASGTFVPPKRAASKIDRDGFGDPSFFAADYGYESRWALAVTSSLACSSNFAAFAKLDANVTVFGHRAQVVEATARFDVRGAMDPSKLGGQLKVLNNVVWDTSRAADATRTRTGMNVVLRAARPIETRQEVARFDQVFTVIGIPVTVHAAAVGALGLEWQASAKLPGADCDHLSIAGDLDVKPYARLSGEASVGVGVPGFGAGVGGEVTIIRVDVPLRLAVSGDATQSISDLVLRVSTRGDLVLRTLDGRVYVYVELLFFRASADIFTWKGMSFPVKLFEDRWALPFGTVIDICGRPHVECDR